MERISVTSKSLGKSNITLLLFSIMFISMQYCLAYNTNRNNFSSQNQYLSSDCSSIDLSPSRYSIDKQTPIVSEEEIIDNGDDHRVYQLFDSASSGSAFDLLTRKLNSNNLKLFNNFAINFSLIEKTILLKSFLI